jgi:hypothetical protein
LSAHSASPLHLDSDARGRCLAWNNANPRRHGGGTRSAQHYKQYGDGWGCGPRPGTDGRNAQARSRSANIVSPLGYKATVGHRQGEVTKVRHRRTASHQCEARLRAAFDVAKVLHPSYVSTDPAGSASVRSHADHVREEGSTSASAFRRRLATAWCRAAEQPVHRRLRAMPSDGDAQGLAIPARSPTRLVGTIYGR